MKYLLLLPALLLMACAEKATNDASASTEKLEAGISPEQERIPSPNSSLSTTPDFKCLAVAADKMNVLYLGFENPVTVSIAEFDKHRVTVSATNAKVRGSGSKYIVNPEKVGEVVLTVSTPLHGEIGTFLFRAKHIPDPKLRLGGSFSGEMAAEKFNAQMGVYAVIEGLDINATCAVSGFQLRRMSPDGVTKYLINRGGKFSEEALELVREATPGDVYIVNKATFRCPGDQVGRVANALVFDIV